MKMIKKIFSVLVVFVMMFSIALGNSVFAKNQPVTPNNKSVNNTKKQTDKAAKDAQKQNNKAVKDVQKQEDKAAKDAQKQNNKAVKDAQKQEDKAAKDAQKQEDKAAKDAQKQEDKAAKDAQKQEDKVAKEEQKQSRMAEKTKLAEKKQTFQEQKASLDAELDSLRSQISTAKVEDKEQLKAQFEQIKQEVESVVGKIKEIKKQLRDKEKGKYTEQQIQEAEKLKEDIKRNNKGIEVLGLDSIIANGADITLDTPPVVENGRTLVPARAVAEAYGAKVQWNPEKKEITITKDNTKIFLTIGKLNALVNGKSVALDVPAKVINKRTLLPLRFIIENLGLKVDWDNDSGTIEITPPDGAKPADEAQQTDETQPVNEEQSVDETQPTDETQPVNEEQSVNETQPTDETQQTSQAQENAVPSDNTTAGQTEAPDVLPDTNN